ncbi:hypothetical protein ACFY1J_06975 [Streptomyces sp. NPDC001406]
MDLFGGHTENILGGSPEPGAELATPLKALAHDWLPDRVTGAR